MKLTKYPCHALMIKDICQMIGIRTLVYFHKDGVTGCKKIKKDCDN